MSGLPSVNQIGGLGAIRLPLSGISNDKDRLPNTPVITNVGR